MVEGFPAQGPVAPVFARLSICSDTASEASLSEQIDTPSKYRGFVGPLGPTKGLWAGKSRDHA